MDSGYELQDHTADAGVRAWGRTPGEAFAAAARGMFAIVLGRDPGQLSDPGPLDEHTLKASGHDWDTLLVNWLADLVYEFDVDGFVPLGYRFERCEPPECSVTIMGTRVEDPAEVAGVLIKAVTYHLLEVEVTPDRTEVNVIFDI